MEAIWTSEVERTNDNIPDSPGGWADEAVLAYDHDRGALIYITSSRYHTFGRTWVLGEEGWREEHEAIDVSSDQFWAGHWDASRAGVACWSIYNDYVAGRRVPVGVLSSAAGVTLIETSGEVIIDDAPSSRESCAIFGQEHGGRARTWMITTTRIYALEDGVWSQVYHFDEDEIASDWRNATSGRAVWDAHRQRLVISLIDDEHDELVLYHFDGERFARLGMEGLPAPEDFYDHWKNGAFAIASAQTEAKGVYLILGDPHGTYRLGEADVWERVDTENEPMRSNKAPAAFDERDGSLWLGPGEYQLVPEVYAKQQEVFYKLDAQRWRVFGDVETPSPSDIYQGVVFAAHEGELHIITRQYEPLAYRIARDGGWEDVISKEDAPAALNALGLSGDAVVEAAAIDGSGVLHAFFRDGAVARWGGDGWSLVAGSDEATFKVRQGFCVAWHDVLECFVAWGGEVKNRASNHTFYLGEAGWKKEKKSSPRLAKERTDGARLMRDTAYIVFDSHTRTLLRFRFAEVSVFENGVWVERTPTGYEQVASMIAPYPVADPVTGEVLLLDFFEHICWRFGFDGVERVATLVDHPRAANPDTGTHKDVPPFLLAGEYAYDRSRAMIIGQGSKNAAMQFTLALREVFDSARSLGERAESSAGEHAVEEEGKDVSFGDEVRLYDPSKGHFWGCSREKGAGSVSRERRCR